MRKDLANKRAHTEEIGKHQKTPLRNSSPVYEVQLHKVYNRVTALEGPSSLLRPLALCGLPQQVA